jgi:hypothetical protein
VGIIEGISVGLLDGQRSAILACAVSWSSTSKQSHSVLTK